MHPEEEELFHEALMMSAYGASESSPLTLHHNSKLEEPLITHKLDPVEVESPINESEDREGSGGGEVELQVMDKKKSPEEE